MPDIVSLPSLPHLLWPGVTTPDMELFDHLTVYKGTSGGVMVSMLDWQTYASECDSHWVPYSCGLVLHLSIRLGVTTLDMVLSMSQIALCAI